MHLKKMVLYGFKSFADKIQIDLDDADWITAIVGPNGCGKSNIVDAVQWVLGEQSIKSMRAKERSDVIFSGTSQRKPVNFAEVTLVFNDNQGILPLEYTSVAITRRIYRSGESMYLINKHPVRLKDIQELFLDTGLGPNGYAIFKQGKMDEIIQQTPKERRHMFLRASGVERFMEKKYEAQKKLEEADHNIERVMDLVREIEKEMGQLEQQVAKALRFTQKQKEYEELRKRIALHHRNHFQQKKEVLSQQQKKLDQEHQEVSKRWMASQSQLEEEKRTLAISRNRFLEKKGLYLAQNHKKEYAQKEWNREEENRKKYQDKKKQWLLEEEENVGKKKRLEQEEQSLEQQNRSLEIEGNTLEEKGRYILQNLEKEEVWEKNWRQKRGDRIEEYQKITEEIANLEKDLHQKELHSENFLQKLDALQEQNQDHSTRETHLQKQKKEIAVTLAYQQQQWNACQEEMFSLEEKIETLTTEKKECERVRKEKEQEYQQTLSRLQILQRFHDEKNDLSSDTKKILTENRRKASPLFEKITSLNDLIVSKKGQEEMVATMLRPYLQTLVVQTKKDLQNLLSFCKEKGIHEYSLLCLEKIKLKSLSSTHPFFNQEKTHPSILSLFQDLLEVKNLEEAFLYVQQGENKEAWISSGSFLDHRGILHHFRLSETNIYLRTAELKELETKRKHLVQSLEKQENEIKKLEEKITAWNQTKGENDRQWRQCDLLLAEQKLLDKQLQEQKTTLQEQKQSLSKKQEQWTKALHQYKQEIEEDTALMQKLTQQKEEIYTRLQQEEQQANHRLQQLAHLRDQQREIDKRRALFFEERNLLREKANLSRLERQEWENIHFRKKEGIKECEQGEQRCLARKQQLEEQIKKIEEEENLSQREYTTESEKIEWLEHAIQEREEEKEKAFERKNRLSEQIYENKMVLENMRISCEQYEQECQERNASSEDLSPINEKDIDYLERKVRRLQEEITHVSDVNMNATEEYDEKKERFLFFQQQIEDYSRSRDEFGEIIAQLEQESRKKLRSVLNRTKDAFQKNFSLLFQGGEADLLLVDEEDILEAGIEIVARPPGKNQRSLSLLSGGEKCLTAIALLLAVFSVKPSPFCLLDEMDAPLDESNVDRFLDLIHSFEKETPFILITHNKRTMKKANRILGVSMEEKGVSKVLSMHLSQEKTAPMVV